MKDLIPLCTDQTEVLPINLDIAAQRIGSPAADYSKTRLHKTAFSTK
jgi:hypothetical protein